MKRFLLPLVLLLLAGVPMSAFAQESTETAMQPAARDRWDRGVRLLDVQSYTEAIAEFQAGYDIDPNPLFLYNLALAYRKSGQCAKAIETYRAFLRAGPVPKLEAHAQRGLRECQADLESHRPPAVAPALAAPPAPPVVALPREPRWFEDKLGDALCIGGLVALATGVVLWKLGHDGLEEISTAPTYGDFRNRVRDASGFDQEQTAGVVAVAAGSALVVGGLLRYSLRPTHPVTVAGSVGPGGAFVMVGKRF